tara:strand:+ start:398 stop:1642 length:1245 start_codon:yes stop_codon:yes gene_type:complete
MTQYQKTKFKGIRLKVKSKTYEVSKSINGKRYYENFKNLRDAKHWRENFHPLINATPSRSNPLLKKVSGFKNGADSKITLYEMFEKYKAHSLCLLSETTQYKKVNSIKKFLTGIEDFYLCDLNPEIVASIITEKKVMAKITDPQRLSFKRELKDLSSVFNWYTDIIDFNFRNPIKTFHFEISKVKEKELSRDKMSAEDFITFIDSFAPKQQLYKDMAILQFYTASRISEIAGIKISNIDLSERTILMNTKMVWKKGKPPENSYSSSTKHINKVVFINEAMFEIITRYLPKKKKGCDTLFHRNGEYIRYNAIQRNFNIAIEASGLGYSGTHILRKGMTNTTRKILTLDHSQAIANHKTRRTTETYYTDLDESAYSLNREASIGVEKYIKGIQGEVKNVVKCGQGVLVMPESRSGT